MRIDTVCVLGGTGFLGRSVINELIRNGYKVIVPTRNREKNRHDLILLPGVELVQLDIHNKANLIKLFKGCDAVINLVGILNEPVHDSSYFYEVHVNLVRKAAEAARVTGLKRFIQISAIGASSSKGSSDYLRTKGEAEMILRASPNIKLSIVRPSLIFGPDDGFFPRFAQLLKLTPVLPLACPKARFAPVYVRDAATAIVKIMQHPDAAISYQLCGKHTYDMLQLVRYTARCLGLRRIIWPMNDAMSYVMALICEYVPGKPFSLSNYYSMKTDFVCDKVGGDMFQLGIEPTAIEVIVPYLLRSPEKD